MAKERAIICGSPRKDGVSARISLFTAALLRDRVPDGKVNLFFVDNADVAPCIGCERCRETHECFMHDDMDYMMDLLAGADELIVVSPVYFAGPPAQLKAVLDRMQPHFWMRTRSLPKRPAHLMAVGDGGDPHGFDPLVVCTRSALAVAGFSLQTVSSCIGRNPDVAARNLVESMGLQ